jgi:hypothetical protein
MLMLLSLDAENTLSPDSMMLVTHATCEDRRAVVRYDGGLRFCESSEDTAPMAAEPL